MISKAAASGSRNKYLALAAAFWGWLWSEYVSIDLDMGKRRKPVLRRRSAHFRRDRYRPSRRNSFKSLRIER
jgi:hypothetical protein